MKGSSCISAEELILYREGKVTGERFDAVRRHLDECAMCEDTLLHVDESDENEPAAVPADFMKNVNRVAREAWEERRSLKRLAAGGKAN